MVCSLGSSRRAARGASRGASTIALETTSQGPSAVGRDPRGTIDAVAETLARLHMRLARYALQSEHDFALPLRPRAEDVAHYPVHYFPPATCPPVQTVCQFFCNSFFGFSRKILVLRRVIFRPPRVSAATMEELIALRRGLFWYVECGNAISLCAVVHTHTRSFFFILSLYVRPPARQDALALSMGVCVLRRHWCE